MRTNYIHKKNCDFTYFKFFNKIKNLLKKKKFQMIFLSIAFLKFVNCEYNYILSVNI